MTEIEEKLRTTLRLEAARVSPSADARRENERRLRARSRYRLIALPAVAAASVLIISVGVLATRQLPERAGPHRGTSTSGVLPRNLDPRYKPIGPVVRVAPAPGGYGKPVLMWEAAGGQVCWRQDTGGGNCGTGRRTAVRHGLVAVVTQFPNPAKGINDYVYYGTVDGQVAKVELIDKNGRRFPGMIAGRAGMPRRLWQAGLPVGGLDMLKVRVVFLDAAGRELARIEHPMRTDQPFMIASPQTIGVPLFTSRCPLDTKLNAKLDTKMDGGRCTLYARADGERASFETLAGDQSLESGGGPSPSKRGTPLIALLPRAYPPSFDAPWAYGFVRRNVAKVVVRLADGRTVPARVVPVGDVRAFSARLPGDRQGKRPRVRDLVIAYDANGRELGRTRLR